MNPQEIFERATLMLERGISRSIVDEWVADQTGQGDGFPLSYGQLRQSFETPTEGLLRKIVATPDFLLNTVPETALAILTAVPGIPKAIVEKLAGDVDEETGFRDPQTGGLSAVGDAAQAAVQFVVDDFAEYGPGALIEGGGAAGLLPLGGKGGKALKTLAKEEKRIRKVAKSAKDELNKLFPPHERGAEGNPEWVSRFDAILEEENKALRELKSGREMLADETLGEAPPTQVPAMPTPEELAARQARTQTFEPSGEVVEMEGVGQVSREFAEAKARQQASVSAQAASAGRKATMIPIDPNLPVLERVEQVRKNYMAAKGYDDVPIPQLGPGDTDEAFHKKWAEIYDRAGKDVNPETEAAWRAMVREVEEQAEWLQRAPEEGGAGLRYEMVGDDPYANHGEMLKDLEETGEIKVFKTPEERVVEGAGEGGIGTIPPSGIGGTWDLLDFHPLIDPAENDTFRWVHDVLGHGVGRNTFDLHGETQAAWQHMAMFSPEARPAVAVETLGQNSAFYHGARSGSFQEQKVFMPSDERMLGIGYQNLDDVPAAVVPEKRPGPAEVGAMEIEAAVRWPDGSVDTGQTHFFALGERPYEEVQHLDFEEGFVIDGQFVDRVEANKRVFGDETEGLHTGDFEAHLDILARQQDELGGADDVIRLTGDGGGSTYNPRTGENFAGRDLWAVSEGSKSEEFFEGMFTPEQYDAFLARHADYLAENPNVVVGTWDDRARTRADGSVYEPQDHGKVELNLTRTFTDQGEARNFALDNDQWGFGNLADPRLQDPDTAGDAFAAANDSFAQARNRAYLDDNVESRRIRREASYRANASPEILEAFERGPSGRPRPQAQKDKILRTYSMMPLTQDGAAFATLGVEAGRYYQSGAKAVFDMFGEDAPRFLSVKAALSPNVADANSSLGAMELWADWLDAGRPQDRAWMDEALDRMATKYGLTNHNLNNLERSLVVPAARLLEPDILKKGGLVIGFPKGEGVQAGKDVLSGLKVSPYYGNLMGELQRLVMDTHARGSLGVARGNTVNKLDVLGATPAFQAYADELTKLTGKPWTVAEVQAAQWAPTIALKNLAKRRMEQRLGRGLRPGEQPEAFRDVPEVLESMGLEAQAGFSDLQPALGLEELAEEIRRAPNMAETFRSDEAAPLLRRLGIEPPAPVDDMSKLGSFLDDPEVRLGDIMDMAKRIAQSTGDSLTGVLALLISQGVMDSVNGRELVNALAEEAGLNGVNNLTEAYDINPGGTMEYLMFMNEQPEADEAEMNRFGDALGIEQAPDLVNTLRGSVGDPEPVGRSSNIRRFGPQVGRRAPVSPAVPPAPVRDPLF